MSSALRCPTPTLCHARSHLPGTAAAAACQARRAKRWAATPSAAPPPPTADQEQDHLLQGPELARAAAATLGLGAQAPASVALRQRALEAVADLVRADLAAADEREGWDPASGQPHPSGGYTHRAVSVLNGGGLSSTRVNVHYGDGPLVANRPSGTTHREDGPAMVERDLFGKVTYERWVVRGALHRGDGPAAVRHDSEIPGSYFHQGVSIQEKGDLGERCQTLIGFGADPATVVGWLAHERDHGRRTTRALLKAGVDIETARKCAEAGVDDAKTVAAIARGELPLSWAVAGS